MDAISAKAWATVADLAARQHGRVARRQLLPLGIGRGAIEKAVRSGRLHREHDGVYAVGHRAPTRHGRWMAAVLACGPGAVLSHRSAATLWGVRDGEGPRTDVTSPGGAGRTRRGIAGHRSPLPPGEVTRRDGIPVTTVARTLADLAHVLEPDDLTRAVREAQYRRLFDRNAVADVLDRRPSALLKAILDDMTAATSPLEDAFLRLLDRYGIPRPEGQRRLLGHRADFVWHAAKLVVEVDGFAAHTTADAFQRDRSQSNVLQLAGYLVLRFTAADVRRRPRQTADRVRAALSRSAR